MNPCDASAAMSGYAAAKTSELIDTFAAALNAAAADPHADAVHDMRVSIRRLQQALRLFRQYLPRRKVRELRATLKRVMEPAGELRNFDIALELAARNQHLLPGLSERRATAQAALAAALNEVAAPDLAQRWTAALKLESR